MAVRVALKTLRTSAHEPPDDGQIAGSPQVATIDDRDL